MVDARTKRLTLIACILGSMVVFVDGTVDQRGAAVDPRRPRHRSRRAAVDRRGLPADARRAAAGRRLARRPARPAADLHRRAGRVRRHLGAVRARADRGAAASRRARCRASRARCSCPRRSPSSPSTFPPEERGAAIGTWTAWAGIATVIGPFGGGLLVDTASWRWIFAINVPFVLATLALVRAAVPESVDAGVHAPHRLPRRAARRARARRAGVRADRAADLRLRRPDRLLPGADRRRAARRVRAARAPLGPPDAAARPLPLAQLRGRQRRRRCSSTRGLGAATFFVAIYLQQVAGYTAVAAGLTLMPITVIMFLLSRRFGALSDRIGPRALMGAGPLVGGLGLIWMGRQTPTSTTSPTCCPPCCCSASACR